MKKYEIGMLKRQESRSRFASHRSYFFLLAFLVAVTVLFTWKKVETASVARRINNAEIQAANLIEERAKLTALVAFKKKPGNIKKIAEEELGMVYPTGKMVDFIVEVPHPKVEK